MTVDSLRNAVLEKDWKATHISDRLGADAVPVLIEMMKEKDDEVRLIAITCLSLIQDEQVIKTLAEALSDPSEDVRTRALQSLRTKYNMSIYNDLRFNLHNNDENVRGGVAIIIGLLGEPGAMPYLSKQLEQEPDAAVQRKLRLALARLGDTEIQDDFAAPLDSPEPNARYRAIQHLEYINDKRLAPRLLIALDDESPAFNIGDVDEPEYGRVCDAAVNAASLLLGDPFGFEVHDAKKYSDEEIEEVRTYLKGLQTE